MDHSECVSLYVCVCVCVCVCLCIASTHHSVCILINKKAAKWMKEQHLCFKMFTLHTKMMMKQNEKSRCIYIYIHTYACVLYLNSCAGMTYSLNKLTK